MSLMEVLVKVIDLWQNLLGLSLVIRFPSGVTYRNYVGRQRAHLHDIEGVLIPLGAFADITARLDALPCTDNTQAVDAGIVDEIDNILSSCPSFHFLRVERDLQT